MIEITADNLVLEYAKDEIETNSKYSGKKVKVTGEIFFIGESNGGSPMILFRPPKSTRLILGGYFNGSWNGKDKLLVEGTQILQLIYFKRKTLQNNTTIY